MGFWSKFATIAQVVAPTVLSVIPGVPPALIPVVAQGITEAESLPGATGAEKKQHVINLVTEGMTGVNAVHPVADPAVVTAAVSQGIDAVVSTVNNIKAVHDTLPPAAAAPSHS